MRACVNADECWGWSKVRYLDVGRDAKDFNGDGYADVVVGASHQNNVEGRAYLYIGSDAGPAATPDLSLYNPVDPVTGRGFYGISVAFAGDVSADGCSDIVVGPLSRPTCSTALRS